MDEIGRLLGTSAASSDSTHSHNPEDKVMLLEHTKVVATFAQTTAVLELLLAKDHNGSSSSHGLVMITSL